MAHWLLQHNPARGVCDAATGGDWVIRRYRDRVAPGDDVALWMSGPGGGVVAVGTVVDEPHDGPYGTVIGVALPRSFPRPITRDELRADERFRTALVLRMPAGGNPFPLSDAEWQAIADHVVDADRPDA